MTEKRTARQDVETTMNAICDALEIEGHDPFPLGYAVTEFFVNGRVIRVEVTAPRKPWIGEPS